MSKAALYAGLGQGLMALGQGAGKAFETMAIEEMRERNLQRHWAREDKIRKEQSERESARDTATAEYRKKMLELQGNRNSEDAAQFDVGSLKDAVSAVDRQYQDRIESLQEANLSMEEIAKQQKALMIERDRLKLEILNNAPDEVLKRSHLIGTRDNLRQWNTALEESLKSADPNENQGTGESTFLDPGGRLDQTLLGGGTALGGSVGPFLSDLLGGLMNPSTTPEQKPTRMKYTASGASVPDDEEEDDQTLGPYSPPKMIPTR